MGQSPFGFIGMNCSSFCALGFAPMRSECFCWIVHCINAHRCAFEWLAVEEVRSNLCAFPGAPLVRDRHRWGLFSHQRLVEHLYLQHLLHYPHFHYGNVYCDDFDIRDGLIGVFLS